MSVSIIAGITATKASLELARLISDRLNHPDIDVADIRSKVHEMLIHMFESQVSLGESQEENRQLRQQIEDLRKEQEDESSLIFVENVYWRKLSDTLLDGPFCPICREKDRRISRLRFDYESQYYIQGHGGPTIPKRKYNCQIHEKEYVIVASLFTNVKVHWPIPK